jgi:mono/diheme cytochrome c family protein
VDLLLTVVADKDSNVRASAVHLCRSLVNRVPEPAHVQELAVLANDPEKLVRMQLVLTLGLVNHALADRTLEPILKDAAADPNMLETLLAGFSGRETEFLAIRLAQPHWASAEPWRQKLLTASGSLLSRQRQPLAVLRFLHLVGEPSEERAWQQIALLEGLAAGPPKGPKGKGTGPRAIALPTAPANLEKLRKSSNAKLAAAAESVAKQLNWPGKDGKPLPVPPPLSAKHQTLYDLGRKEYLALCAACHHAAGYGDPGKGPALLDADWLDYSEERLVLLVLYGLRGSITVNGEPFNQDGALEMPGMYQVLDDEKIAGILTFVRREWGQKAPPIETAAVARIRTATLGRTDQWTEKELLKIK